MPKSVEASPKGLFLLVSFGEGDKILRKITNGSRNYRNTGLCNTAKLKTTCL